MFLVVAGTTSHSLTGLIEGALLRALLQQEGYYGKTHGFPGSWPPTRAKVHPHNFVESK